MNNTQYVLTCGVLDGTDMSESRRDLSDIRMKASPFMDNSKPIPFAPIVRCHHPQRDNLLALHATLQDALTWLDETPVFDDYRRKVIACLRSTEQVLGMAQSRTERKR